MLFMRARYFDAIAGRFITGDPSGYSDGSPNLYQYVRNSPMSAIDPSGFHMEFAPGEAGHTHCSNGGYSFTDYNPIYRNDPTFPFGCTVAHERVHQMLCDSGLGSGMSGDCQEAAAYAASAKCSGSSSEQAVADEYARKCQGTPPAPPTPPPCPIKTGSSSRDFLDISNNSDGCNDGGSGPSQPTRPVDPNDLIGPAGYGPQHYVEAT